jgi:hypothetical protein
VVSLDNLVEELRDDAQKKAVAEMERKARRR